MASIFTPLRSRLDRIGVLLSFLCALHCLTGLLVVVVLGAGGGLLLDPAIHRVGLAAATIIAGIAIGLGFLRHRRREPLIVATAGLLFMAGALVVGHGPGEILLTVIGVALVASGHMLNIRRA